jgi:predicted HAD superfamily Cof-like phosphohydrolase
MHEEINDFTQDVITLHGIARKIEHEIGKGQLSEDLRKLADKLSDLIKKV